ncbi:hypothetical protein AVEN_177821-1 [Araneus ventricosus]|uniref:Retrovirus-related Pol polyprotein from transposon TNT 1-94 n=1 Tax=Araneus ventricosus TaxID=182803 RepID=A0A4Y2NA46_ARAVE|nr:hypothetical protein AVEN_177821-1 [Araneus ventricosus]
MNDTERRKKWRSFDAGVSHHGRSFLDDIGDTLRAKDAWEALKEMHTKFGLLHILRLMKDFFSVILKPNESVKSYLGRLMDVHKNYLALIMLIGLPKPYEALIINLEKDETNISKAMVKSRLLVEEKRMSRTESEDVTHED